MGSPKPNKPTLAEAKTIEAHIGGKGGGTNPIVEGARNHQQPAEERRLIRAQTMAELERYAYNKDPRCFFTADILYEMRTYFLIGGTDAEACRYAGVLPNAYYVWRKNMPADLREEWDELVIKWKDENVSKARFLISQQVAEDVNLSKWYLERKRKDEFAPQAQLELKQVDQFSSLDDDLLKGMIESIRDKESEDEQSNN